MIEEVHQRDKQISMKIRPDLLFIHQDHEDVGEHVQEAFPKRFELFFYNSIGDINKKILKPKSGKWNSYLVLSEGVSGEKVPV